MINRIAMISAILGLAAGLGLTSVAKAQEVFIGEIRIFAEMTVAASEREEAQFKLQYQGNGASGVAIMTMTKADGSELRDQATGCGISAAGSRWTLVCNNPHFVTWDTVFYDFARGPELSLSSEVLTEGRQTFMRILSPVQLGAIYDPRPDTPAAD